jgi:pectin methylesterase-like acyl-CoA thioesterase
MHICRRRRRLALNALLLLALPVAILAPVSAAPTVAAAQALSVDGSAPAASDTTCMPCKTIQGAINRASPGDGITVAPGTYPETLTITQSVSITGGVARLPGEQGPTIVDAGGRAVWSPSPTSCRPTCWSA